MVVDGGSEALCRPVKLFKGSPVLSDNCVSFRAAIGQLSLIKI